MEQSRRLSLAGGRALGGFPGMAPSPYDVAWVLLATTLASLVVYQLGVKGFVAVAALGAAGVAMFVRPDFAIVLTAIFLYLNVPAILHKHHGLPEMLAGAFILALGIPLLRSVVLRRERLRADPTFVLMLVFLLVLFLSMQFAKDTGIAANYIRRYLLEGLLIFWLFTNVVRTMPQLRRLIGALVVAGALMGTLNLYQEVTKSYDQKFGGLAYRPMVEVDETTLDKEPSGKVKHLRADRAHGPVEEPNRFGQIMVVLLPLAIFLARSASRRARLYWSGAAVLILAGVLVSYSRGAMITLVLVTIAAVSMRWIRPIYLIGSAVAVMIIVPIVAPHMITRVTNMTEAAAVMSDDPTDHAQMDGAIAGRATEMLAAFYAFRDHPLLGVGPGQYAPMYSIAYMQAGVHFRDRQITRRAHSLYIEMAAELGAVGLTVFLCIVGALLRGLWKARCRLFGRHTELTSLATACMLTILAYLGTGLFLHLAYQRYYWFLLAVGAAALRIIRDIESVPHTPDTRVTISRSAAPISC